MLSQLTMVLKSKLNSDMNKTNSATWWTAESRCSLSSSRLSNECHCEVAALYKSMKLSHFELKLGSCIKL